jgi:hypothetical protein
LELGLDEGLPQDELRRDALLDLLQVHVLRVQFVQLFLLHRQDVLEVLVYLLLQEIGQVLEVRACTRG